MRSTWARTAAPIDEEEGEDGEHNYAALQEWLGADEALDRATAQQQRAAPGGEGRRARGAAVEFGIMFASVGAFAIGRGGRHHRHRGRRGGLRLDLDRRARRHPRRLPVPLPVLGLRSHGERSRTSPSPTRSSGWRTWPAPPAHQARHRHPHRPPAQPGRDRQGPGHPRRHGRRRPGAARHRRGLAGRGVRRARRPFEDAATDRRLRGRHAGAVEPGLRHLRGPFAEPRRSLKPRPPAGGSPVIVGGDSLSAATRHAGRSATGTSRCRPATTTCPASSRP